MSPVSVVHVVVPAHDEEARVARALGAALEAARRVRSVHRGLVVRTTVVLDACSDATAAIVADLGLDTVVTTTAMVGAARRAGVERAGACALGVRADAVWIACTDADSVVPATWLLDQLALARDHDLVLGRVRPDPSELTRPVLAEWQRRHPPGAVHVHGANMGFRLSSYVEVGGFPAVPEHEDQHLAAALRTAGCRWTTSEDAPVLTSARREGRTGGGFAAYLRGMESAMTTAARADLPVPDPG